MCLSVLCVRSKCCCVIGPPDDPEDPLLEASAERGRGGGEQEGGTVPPHPERADRGEGDEHPAAEAAARSAPADKVHTRTHTHTLRSPVVYLRPQHQVQHLFSFTTGGRRPCPSVRPWTAWSWTWVRTMKTKTSRRSKKKRWPKCKAETPTLTWNIVFSQTSNITLLRPLF